MRQRSLRWFGLLVVLVFLAGCVASRIDEGKRQYEIALQSDDPIPYYNAALEELDAVIKRDPGNYQAYALKGLIYRNLEEYDRAIENLDKAKQGSFTGAQEWVGIVMNLTYGDVFHVRAADALNSGDAETAKNYQNTALEFFNNVINTSFSNFGESSENAGVGPTMHDLYINAQGRWAAAKFQMATIAQRLKNQAQETELLREVATRLSSVVEMFPNATVLRYYFADGYRKQALVIRKTDPTESERLQQLAMAQLRVCAELGLPGDMRSQAAQLFHTLSKGAETDIEQKILGTPNTENSEEDTNTP